MKTCLIQIQIGEPIQEIGGKQRRGILKKIAIKPNGMNDPKLIAVLHVDFDNGASMSATSDKFTVVDDYEYSDSPLFLGNL